MMRCCSAESTVSSYQAPHLILVSISSSILDTPCSISSRALHLPKQRLVSDIRHPFISLQILIPTMGRLVILLTASTVLLVPFASAALNLVTAAHDIAHVTYDNYYTVIKQAIYLDYGAIVLPPRRLPRNRYTSTSAVTRGIGLSTTGQLLETKRTIQLLGRPCTFKQGRIWTISLRIGLRYCEGSRRCRRFGGY